MLSSLVDINTIYEKLKSIFGKVKLYGSVSDGNFDKYSDLDVEITVKSFLSEADFINLVNNIGPSWIIFPIFQNDESSIFTILFKDYRFYQKLDLRIIGKVQKIKFDESKRSFWDFYLGAIRYCKYSKRKMYWSAYKFYHGMLEIYLKIQLSKDNLIGEDYVGLDKAKFGHQDLVFIKNTDQMDKKAIHIINLFRQANEYHPKFQTEVVKFIRGELVIRK